MSSVQTIGKYEFFVYFTSLYLTLLHFTSPHVASLHFTVRHWSYFIPPYLTLHHFTLLHLTPLQLSLFCNSLLLDGPSDIKPFEATIYKQTTGLGMSLVGGGLHGRWSYHNKNNILIFFVDWLINLPYALCSYQCRSYLYKTLDSWGTSSGMWSFRSWWYYFTGNIVWIIRIAQKRCPLLL